MLAPINAFWPKYTIFPYSLNLHIASLTTCLWIPWNLSYMSCWLLRLCKETFGSNQLFHGPSNGEENTNYYEHAKHKSSNDIFNYEMTCFNIDGKKSRKKITYILTLSISVLEHLDSLSWQ